MAFIRLVGCSVGQKVCVACDTDFSAVHEKLGGGFFTPDELMDWVGKYSHVCITGGEPLDRNLYVLVQMFTDWTKLVHIETSGTVYPDWLDLLTQPNLVWVTVSPKPGYLLPMIERADELKVIIGGLGDGPGWPSLEDARRWALHKTVYIQPRNQVHSVDRNNLEEAKMLVCQYPELRLSVQQHKFLGVR